MLFLLTPSLTFLKTTVREPCLPLCYLARAVSDLLGLAATRAAVVEDAGVAGVGADVLQGCRVAVVAVDARDLAAVSCRRALDVNVPLALGLAL